ncbi:C40 family peptidase [candidate division KSB1 bacterium]|nr:C40 family peptidase [candidate division KSB1 bacterium]NIR73260.1 C40 family peptidase [candidate division KSB1 bacterium]NIS26966.1 C40 family peptidase [candidate division KSB1 bacterium]NIT73805.1 C40 family peptidase [candidate division KSB1 bacterium]NIU27710.1 C40 family peptidase [candidate division KSB1 bacterium]
MKVKILGLLGAGCLLLSCWYCGGLRPKPKYTEPNTSENSDRYHGNSGLDREKTSSSVNRALTQQINAYLGVPYRWGGTTRSGMDCSGFVRTVFKNAIELTLPHRARSMFKEGRFVEESELQFGDLVFFEKIENYGVSHVGIYVGENEFAHASTHNGVIISNLNEKYYRRRYVGARRILKR